MMMFVEEWWGHLANAVVKLCGLRCRPVTALTIPRPAGLLDSPSAGLLLIVYWLGGRSLFFVSPAEVGAIDPHAVQDDGKLASHGDAGIFERAALGEAHAPCF
jgi:hypothetical protein